MVWAVIFGLVIFIIGLVGLIRVYLRSKNWILTEAEVYSHRESRSSGENSSTSYYELIRYEIKGKEILKHMSYSTGFPYAIGRVLPILYNPHDKQKIIIKTFSRMYLLPLGILLCGVFLLYGSFMMP